MFFSEQYTRTVGVRISHGTQLHVETAVFDSQVVLRELYIYKAL